MKAGTGGGRFRRRRAATRRGVARKALHRFAPRPSRTDDETLIAEVAGTDRTTPETPDVTTAVAPPLHAGPGSVGARRRRSARPARCRTGEHDSRVAGAGPAVRADFAPAGPARRAFAGGHFYLIARRAEPTGVPAESLEGVR
ncbi:hypothetical protein OG596_20085 [Streptomyces sp. NBC_01102]|uniref:hypothetical protein n=1 Tax=unclassified Streptomyces TaxID=2593676 RepID=UPI003865B3C5|nr:hypothetical protein OG596_20085 [Streptomyces sp. NBC_01102]